MSVLHRNRTAVAHPATATPAEVAPPQDRVPPHDATPPPSGPSRDPSDPIVVPDAPRPRRTRISGAWLGVCTATAALLVLIVFMLQNTRSVEVSFLWMHGIVPLALALLTAGVAVAIVAIAFGQARISQLGRAARRQR
jgi:uncharacterized integral membrane protein